MTTKPRPSKAAASLAHGDSEFESTSVGEYQSEVYIAPEDACREGKSNV